GAGKLSPPIVELAPTGAAEPGYEFRSEDDPVVRRQNRRAAFLAALKGALGGTNTQAAFAEQLRAQWADVLRDRDVFAELAPLLPESRARCDDTLIDVLLALGRGPLACHFFHSGKRHLERRALRWL